MNPDPSIFPPNHPYRRGQSSGEIPKLGGLAMTSAAPAPPRPEAGPSNNGGPQGRPQPQPLQEPQRPLVQPQQPQPGPSHNQQSQAQPRGAASGLQQARPQAPPTNGAPAPPPLAKAPSAPPGPISNISTDAQSTNPPSVPPSPLKTERRQNSLNAVVTMGIRGLRSLGLPFTKSSAAVPVSSQIQVGSVKAKGEAVPPVADTASGRPNLSSSNGGQRQKGPPPGQEMESDDEDEPDNGVQLSQSLAQHKLSLFAAKQGIHATALPVPHESEELPAWAQQQQPQGAQAQQQVTVEAQVTATVAQPTPIPVMHPYNLPFSAAPATPRTVRRQMLRSEMSESLRRQLLWERKQGGIRKTSSSTMVNGEQRRQHSVLNPLRPMTAAPSMVELAPKGSQKRRESESAGESGDRRRPSNGKEDRAEQKRLAMARNRSWADDFHLTGW